MIGLFAALLVLFVLASCGVVGENISWKEQYDLGVRYLSEGNYEEAKLAFEAAIVIEPKEGLAYVGLAEVYMAMGEPEKAQAVLERGMAVAENTEEIEKHLQKSSPIKNVEKGLENILLSTYWEEPMGHSKGPAKTCFLKSMGR